MYFKGYINALLHYILVFIIYKTEDENQIDEDVTICGGTEECVYNVQNCIDYYMTDSNKESYISCVDNALFDDDVGDFPNKEYYYNKFFKNPNNVREIYFKLILNTLKLCADDEELYNSMYDNITTSIFINSENFGKIDKDIIKHDKDANEIVQKLYYDNFINEDNLFKNYFEFKDNKLTSGVMLNLYDIGNKVNNTLFYNSINEKYFGNTLSYHDIDFIFNNFETNNLETFIIEKNINRTDLLEFGKNVIMKYGSYADNTDIANHMISQRKHSYNVFDMLNNLCSILYRNNEFKYNYSKSNGINENDLDFNSIYENSKSLSESIYNLIYEYYNYIYTVSLNDYNSTEYTTNYYKNEKGEWSVSVKFGDTMKILQKNNFYKNIYSTIITIAKNNNYSNKFINECVKLVNEIYEYYNYNKIKLSQIEKKNISEDKDIVYKDDINFNLDIIFKENTFSYLIENEDKSLYLDNLKSYIRSLCNDPEKNHIMQISAMTLRNKYNDLFVTNEMNEEIRNCEDINKIQNDLIKKVNGLYKDIIENELTDEYLQDMTRNMIESVVAEFLADSYLKMSIEKKNADLMKRDIIFKRGETNDNIKKINEMLQKQNELLKKQNKVITKFTETNGNIIFNHDYLKNTQNVNVHKEDKKIKELQDAFEPYLISCSESIRKGLIEQNNKNNADEIPKEQEYINDLASAAVSVIASAGTSAMTPGSSILVPMLPKMNQILSDSIKKFVERIEESIQKKAIESVEGKLNGIDDGKIKAKMNYANQFSEYNNFNNIPGKELINQMRNYISQYKGEEIKDDIKFIDSYQKITDFLNQNKDHFDSLGKRFYNEKDMTMDDEYVESDGNGSFRLKPKYLRKDFLNLNGELSEKYSDGNGKLAFPFRPKILFNKDGSPNTRYLEKEGDNPARYKFKGNINSAEFVNNLEIEKFIGPDMYLKDNVLDKDGKLNSNYNKCTPIMYELFTTDGDIKEIYREVSTKNVLRKDLRLNNEFFDQAFDNNGKPLEDNFETDKNGKLKIKNVTKYPTFNEYLNCDGSLKDGYTIEGSKLMKITNNEKKEVNLQKTYIYTKKYDMGSSKIENKKIPLSDIFKENSHTKELEIDSVAFENVIRKSIEHKEDANECTTILNERKSELEKSIYELKNKSLKLNFDLKVGENKIPLDFTLGNTPFQCELKKNDFREKYNYLMALYANHLYPDDDYDSLEKRDKVYQEYFKKLEGALGNELAFSRDLSPLINHIKTNDITGKDLKNILNELADPVNSKIAYQKMFMKFYNNYIDSNGEYRMLKLFGENNELDIKYADIDEKGNVKLKPEYRPKKFFRIDGDIEEKYRDPNNQNKILLNYRIPLCKSYKDCFTENGEKLAGAFVENEKTGQLRLNDELREKYKNDEFINSICDEHGYLKDNPYCSSKGVVFSQFVKKEPELEMLIDGETGEINSNYKDKTGKLMLKYVDPEVIKYYNENGEIKDQYNKLKNMILFDESGTIRKEYQLPGHPSQLNKKAINEFKNTEEFKTYFDSEGNGKKDVIDQKGQLNEPIIINLSRKLNINRKIYLQEYEKGKEEVFTTLSDYFTKMTELQYGDKNSNKFVYRIEALHPDEKGFNELVEKFAENLNKHSNNRENIDKVNGIITYSKCMKDKKRKNKCKK